MFVGFRLSWMGTFYWKSSIWAKEAVVFLFRNGLTWACIGNNKLNRSKLIKDILLDNPLYLKVFSMLYLPRKDIGKYISFYKKKKKKNEEKRVAFLSYFEKIAHILYISGFGWISIFVALWLCGFVALWLCGFVALCLCMFGCLLQRPIRLKVLRVDA